jgi:hypothetical protein
MRTRNPWWRPLSGSMAAVFCAALLAGAGAAPAPAAAAPKAAAGGMWGKAIEVPGLAALNKGGDGVISSVSCASAGNCGAGGIYRDGAGRTQVFVASQTNGTWGKAIEVPGSAALNVAGDADFITLSCASPGDCSAGGEYADRAGGFFQAFVVTETKGTWGKAIEIPGIAALNKGGNAEVTALSCASPGNCSAAGHYGSNHGRRVFVVNQRHGTWDKAIEIPGSAIPHRVGFAEVASVSCRAAGDCSAGGSFTDRAGTAQPFVVSETNGTWGKAIEIPGAAALNVGGAGGITSLSCGAVGNCSAGGDYQDRPGHLQAFVASQTHGTWGKAIEVPGTAALNHQNAAVDALSCASPGNCSASGVYTQGRSLNLQPFVVSETNGTWGNAIEAPGITPLNKDGEAHVFSMSCGAAGDCSVGGAYLDHAGDLQAFVVSQAHGTWGKAIEVPGTQALNKGGNAGIESLSCASAGRCSAGGFYLDSHGKLQAFVVSKT